MFMGIKPDVREQATKASCSLVEGRKANPWLIKIDLTTQCPALQSAELRPGIPIFIFELFHCPDFADGEPIHHQTVSHNKFIK